MRKDLMKLTAVELGKKIKDKEVTVVEATKCQILLDAIHKYGDDMDPQLRIEQVSHSHEQTAIRRQNSCWKAMQRKARMKVCGLTARVF